MFPPRSFKRFSPKTDKDRTCGHFVCDQILGILWAISKVSSFSKKGGLDFSLEPARKNYLHAVKFECLKKILDPDFESK